MSDTKVTTSVGPSFLTLLTILFIGLKLTGYVAWSWLWVLSPLWLPVVVIVPIFLLVAWAATRSK